jgi:quercetin dioxygenase-like cupin family protein
MKRIREPDVADADQGPTSEFTGVAWLKRVQADPINLRISYVKFEPRARTHWHWHAGPQYLLVMSGGGAVMNRSGAFTLLEPGDVVFVEPEEEHWHGALPGLALAHIALTAGKTCWRTPVSDREYADAFPDEGTPPEAMPT